jgi:hypothetical protein
MAQEEPVGQQTDMRRGTSGRAGQHQKHLVLLRCQSGGTRSAAAEVQELSDAEAKFFQGTEGRFTRHVVLRHVASLS